MMNDNIFFALLLTTIAGLSTGIGGLVVFFKRKLNTAFLACSLGFSAGVMIYVSFVELFAYSKTILNTYFLSNTGIWVSVASFFGGIAFIAIIDKLIPSVENPHEIKDIDELKSHNPKIARVGIMTALAITIHNFPEGLATLMSGLTNTTLAVSITIAIAIHNIPEGISVAVPILYATGNKSKAFWYAFLSGLAEPLGAIIGCLFLLNFLGPLMFGIVYAVVAGIMVYISFDELLPTAEKYGKHHLAIYGVISGMAIMALSLLIF